MKTIRQELLAAIFQHAERDYPAECCGMILGPRGEDRLESLWPCRNAQDDYHALDAKAYPRTSRTAYFVDPAQLLALQKQARQDRREIKLIYHSHIDSGAMFSEEDARAAAPGGIPSYPGVHYLVVSVRAAKAVEAKLFAWNEERRDFVSADWKS